MATLFCCQFISGLIGEGGAGKSSLRILQLISLAIGRGLTRHKVFQRCSVLIISLEDSRRELQRRLAAARIHHGISKEQIKGSLFYITVEDPKQMKLAVMGPNGPEKGHLAGSAGAHHQKVQDRYTQRRHHHQIPQIKQKPEQRYGLVCGGRSDSSTRAMSNGT
jgi:hypothetical protein